MKDWHDILKTCDLQNWREALAAVMTYAQPDEFSSLCGEFLVGICSCFIPVLHAAFGQGYVSFSLSYQFKLSKLDLSDLLGARLDAAEEARLQVQACLCYICAGNVEKLVACWSRAQEEHCPLSLQVCT